MSNNNGSKIKGFLEDNKIYFETIVTVLLSIMAILVTITSGIISYFQLKEYRIQSQVQISQSNPEFIMRNGSAEEEFIFENIGGIVSDLEVYMTDDIYLWVHKNNEEYNNLININMNGRFSICEQTLSKNGNQEVRIKPVHNRIILSSFKEKIIKNIGVEEEKCVLNFPIEAYNVRISYNNYSNEKVVEDYFIFNGKLMKDSQTEYFHKFRTSTINYDYYYDNEEEIINIIKNRVLSIAEKKQLFNPMPELIVETLGE